jgi:hypothetical protein
MVAAYLCLATIDGGLPLEKLAFAAPTMGDGAAPYSDVTCTLPPTQHSLTAMDPSLPPDAFRCIFLARARPCPSFRQLLVVLAPSTSHGHPRCFLLDGRASWPLWPCSGKLAAVLACRLASSKTVLDSGWASPVGGVPTGPPRTIGACI